MAYRNFTTALYCTVSTLREIESDKTFDERFRRLIRNFHLDKVYLETYGNNGTIDRDALIRLRDYFRSLGIQTSGGIGTTDQSAPERYGFISLCYNNSEHTRKIREAIEVTASIFDEIILDDFFFTNCKCEACVREKGEASWSSYRTERMLRVSKELIVGPAKRVNPKVRVIVKYPNWYDCYQETGYNQKDEPSVFDAIYTGTETRDPLYTEQHLPKYLSYFLMRYNENLASGRNGGGWFDMFECARDVSFYTQQITLTGLAGAKEFTMYSLGELMRPIHAVYPPLAGLAYDAMDRLLPELGRPVGIACYKPYFSTGEDYLHGYLGMIGLPLEPQPTYPERAGKILLTESAAADPDILSRIQKSLIEGSDIMITSGFVRAMQGKGLDRLANLRTDGRRAAVSEYGLSSNGLVFESRVEGDGEVLMPICQFATNDAWQLAFGLTDDGNCPILLAVNYGKGHLYLLVVPDNFGDLYRYPSRVLETVRNVITPGDIRLDTKARVCLFLYDNDTFVVHSMLPWPEEVGVTVLFNGARLQSIEGTDIPHTAEMSDGTHFRIPLAPGEYRAFRVLR